MRGVIALLLGLGALGLIAFWGLAPTLSALIGVVFAIGLLMCAAAIYRGEHIPGGAGAVTVAILGFYLFPGADGIPTVVLAILGLVGLAGFIGMTLHFVD